MSGSRGTRDGAQIIRLSLFSSAECHVRDKIQTIPTNKGSLEGQRGWNIFEEWYCLTPPPPSPSLPHTPPPSPSSRPSALKRSPSRGSSGQRESRDERMIKDGTKIQCACPWCETVHVFDENFFLNIYNEVDTLKLSAHPARIWICKEEMCLVMPQSCCLTPTCQIITPDSRCVWILLCFCNHKF